MRHGCQKKHLGNIFPFCFKEKKTGAKYQWLLFYFLFVSGEIVAQKRFVILSFKTWTPTEEKKKKARFYYSSLQNVKIGMAKKKKKKKGEKGVKKKEKMKRICINEFMKCKYVS